MILDEQLRYETETGQAQVAFYEQRIRDLTTKNREIALSINWSHADYETHKRVMDYYQSLEDLEDARWQLEKAKRNVHS